jgi:hypothetical protein
MVSFGFMALVEYFAFENNLEFPADYNLFYDSYLVFKNEFDF